MFKDCMNALLHSVALNDTRIQIKQKTCCILGKVSMQMTTLKCKFFGFSQFKNLLFNVRVYSLTTHPPYTNTRQFDYEKFSIAVPKSNYPQLEQNHSVLTDNSQHYFPHKHQTKVEQSGCSPVKPACVSYLQ